MPLQRCKVNGKPGWRWGQRGKCYAGAIGKQRALRQAKAILATGWTENVFCPTGAGGGVDPTCSPASATAGNVDPGRIAGELSDVGDTFAGVAVDYGVMLQDAMERADGDKAQEAAYKAHDEFSAQFHDKMDDWYDSVLDKGDSLGGRGDVDRLYDATRTMIREFNDRASEIVDLPGDTVRGLIDPPNMDEALEPLTGWSRGLDDRLYAAAHEYISSIPMQSEDTENVQNAARRPSKGRGPESKRGKNPLRRDPTRTATTRRKFTTEMTKRFDGLKREVQKFLVKEDAFGLRGTPPGLPSGTIGRFRFQGTPEQVETFRRWLSQQTDAWVNGKPAGEGPEHWWKRFIEEGYRKGTGRAFDDTRPQVREALGRDADEVSDFYAGTREEFLRSSFAHPASVEKVKLLAGRVYTDIKGVTDGMAAKVARRLTEGLAKGENPRVIGADLNKTMDAYKKQGLTVARTEISRAHAEGQLDAMERLGVTDVGVMVEWITSDMGVTALGNPSPCDLCAPMAGTVLTIDEARGLLPRHPNCMCGFIPANLGESREAQKRSQSDVAGAIESSIRAEMPAKGDRTIDEQRAKTSWVGADAEISKTRPKSILE